MSIVILPVAVREDGSIRVLAQPRATSFRGKTCLAPGISSGTAVLSGLNGRRLLEALGYRQDFHDAPVAEFAAATCTWLKKHIGRQSEGYVAEEGPLDGQKDGFLNETIMALSMIARTGKDAGATHIMCLTPAELRALNEGGQNNLRTAEPAAPAAMRLRAR